MPHSKHSNLLDYLISKRPIDSTLLPNVALICVQHLLDTTTTLFESFLKIGIPAEHVMVMGKLYSNNLHASNKLKSLGIAVESSTDCAEVGKFHESFTNDCKLLWVNFFEKIQNRPVNIIIVLDDGGNLISNIPEIVRLKYCVIGVEQTTSGIELNQKSKISIINVAGSAVKRYVEPAFISQAVIQKTKRYLLNKSPRNIGIFGFGNIGKALAKDLCITAYKISVFDRKGTNGFSHSNLTVLASPDDLFLKCDFIFGATGKDVSNPNWIQIANENKVLISVSSSDIEYRSLLAHSQGHLKYPIKSLLDNVTIKTEGGYTLSILRGGTPINFDNNIHSVLPEYIQLTRALLLLGVMSAIENSQLLCKESKFVKLDPVWQRNLLNYWVNNVDIRKFDFSIPIQRMISQSTIIEDNSLGV